MGKSELAEGYQRPEIDFATAKKVTGDVQYKVVMKYTESIFDFEVDEEGDFISALTQKKMTDEDDVFKSSMSWEDGGSPTSSMSCSPICNSRGDMYFILGTLNSEDVFFECGSARTYVEAKALVALHKKFDEKMLKAMENGKIEPMKLVPDGLSYTVMDKHCILYQATGETFNW